MEKIENSADASFEKIFKRGRFEIPEYQRSFSWTEEEMNELIDDLEDVKEKNCDDHFMNSIVLNETGKYRWSDARTIGRYNIVDGQQRIISMSLLVSSICEELEYIKNHISDQNKKRVRKTIKENRRCFIGEETSGGLKMKIETDDICRDCYKQAVRNGKSGEELISIYEDNYLSIRRIASCKEVSNERIRNWREEKINSSFVDSTDEEILDYYKFIISMIRKIKDVFSVSVRVVDSYEEAARIFKRINDRGRDLTSFDKIKCHLVYCSTKTESLDPKSVSSDINDVIKDITSLEDLAESDVESYFRNHWSIFSGLNKNSQTAMGGLSEVIKSRDYANLSRENIGNWIRLYTDSVKEFTEPFLKITNSEYFKQEYSGKSMKTIVDRLDCIKNSKGHYTKYEPLLMVIDHHLDHKNRSYWKLVDLIETYSFRYNQIMKKTSNMSEFCTDAAHSMYWCEKQHDESLLKNKTYKHLKVGEYGYHNISHAISSIEDTIKKKVNKLCPDQKLKKYLERDDIISGEYDENWTGVRYEKTIRNIFYEYEKLLRKDSYSKFKAMNLPNNKEWTGHETEHIAPKRPDTKEKYLGNNEEEHERNKNKLGNLVIIDSPTNKKASNKPFNSKKKHYKKSRILILNNLARENKKWTIEDIEKRTEKLQDFILKRWSSVPLDMNIYEEKPIQKDI